MIALVFLIAAVPDSNRLDFQLMTSPAYQAFARKADAMCPARKMRYLHPADLGDFEETFEIALPPRDRRRLARANKGFDGCPPAGMSCPAQHTLGAIIKSGLLDSFTRSACSAPG